MLVESWVIIVLILLMAAIIFRTGRAGQAVAVLPLATVPLFHLLGIPLSHLLDGWFSGMSSDLFQVSFQVVGLVIACVLYGLLAGNMGSRKGRRVYMILCGIFSALLTIVLVNSTLQL
ncbi:hypothetical protein H8711_09335 [Clostridiaceae bacterium NSJ-31]|uniref:Uncharacterized protein n=1 Tax=Ligaoa zhengdingensis TaxID=2763658 RepID=A0A926I484_9FIRM|nr:hypothetical protein [Ligaoa zhengdingensis]MBC8547129.1 hypothetical protein [Ligaoa zhengdingensis]